MLTHVRTHVRTHVNSTDQLQIQAKHTHDKNDFTKYNCLWNPVFEMRSTSGALESRFFLI